MRLQRNINLKGKVYTKKDILAFADILSDIYHHFGEGVHSKLEYEIEFDDNSKIILNYEELISNKNIEIKKTTSVSMFFINNNNNNLVKIHLSIKEPYNSIATIEGEDSSWVHTVYTNIEETRNGFTPQRSFIWKGCLSYIISFFIIVIPLVLLYLSIYINMIEPYQISEGRITEGEVIQPYLIGPLAIILIMSLSFTQSIVDKLREVWPLVEFNFGPEHKKGAKRKRKILTHITIYIIIPIIIAILINWVDL